MTFLKPNRSMEDLRQASTAAVTPKERRARSLSPIKHRRSAPPGKLKSSYLTSPQALIEELSSIASGSSDNSDVSLHKLKKLSKSPLSKKLHIDPKGGSSPYIIPIPFTLQLPPKLSPSNQKVKSRSPSPTPRSASRSPIRQSRLVYTGTGYEKLDGSLSSEEDVDDYEKHLNERIRFSKNKANSPSKRRPIAHNNLIGKNFSGKQIAPTDLNLDGLSIIEEASNSEASSRRSTLKEKRRDQKSLPLLPLATDSEDLSYDQDSSFLSALPRSLHIKNNVLEHLACAPRATSRSGQLMTYESYNSLQSNLQSSRMMSESNVSGTPQKPRGYLVASYSEPFLRITKRSFSDESHVSSISSMTTFNDVMSLATKRFNLLNLNERKISNSSSSGTESTLSECSASSATDSLGSWDSLQKSVDLSVHDSISCGSSLQSSSESQSPVEEAEVIFNRLPPAIQKATPYPVNEIILEQSSIECDLSGSDENETTVEVTITSGADIADIYLEDTTELEQPNESSTEEGEEEEEEKEDDDTTLEDEKNSKSVERLILKSQDTIRENEVDNNGLGKSFSFPNNISNVTNDETVKKRIISTDTYRSGTYSYYSTLEGQIEIPDLSEASFSTAKVLLAVNGITFNDLVTDNETDDEALEPIGIPSKKTQRIMTEQFNAMFSDSDTDIESGKFSLYSNHVKAKSTSHLSKLNEKKLPPIPCSKQNLSPSYLSHVRGHSRHKSLGNIDLNLNDFKINKQPQAMSAIEDNAIKRVESRAETMHIQVAEPPTKINYAVDFKEADGHNDISRSLTPTVTDMFKHKNQRQKSQASKACSSSSNSTYQSSRTERLSASTEASDTGSVIIDLTKDQYDVCMILRNNSTTSYRSVTEKYKGKEVEVVLVDDDNEYKDLESIYSKYRKNWLDRRQSMLSLASSVSSEASSTFSYGSVSSSKQINVKDAGQTKEITHLNSNSKLNKSSTSSRYQSARIKVPKAIQEEEEKYFDYTKSASYYDFNTFISQDRFK